MKLKKVLCTFSHKWDSRNTAPDFRWCLRCGCWEFSDHFTTPRVWKKTDPGVNPEFKKEERVTPVFSDPKLNPWPCITVIDSQTSDVAFRALQVFTMPLCRIADALGVQGIPIGNRLTGGIWISDGSGNGRAYSYLEIINRMTERMSVKTVEEVLSAEGIIEEIQKIRDLIAKNTHRTAA